MLKEEKIATYTEKGIRIQLLKIAELNEEQLKKGSIYYNKIYFQIRTNRKITYKSISEAITKKKFASIITSIILKQKFNF